MSFATDRRNAKNNTSATASRRARSRTRRPSLEPMEDRVVLTTASATVTQLYQDLLHRLPDVGGLTYWTGQLDQGAGTQAVASALTHSTEYHRGEVNGVYQRLLSRTADEGGRAFFATALDQGQTIQQVEAAVASSPEYAHSHGGAPGFLDALFNGADHLKTLVSGAYQQVLHRAGDAGGLAYWAGRMSAGESLGDVTATLAASPERAAMAAPTSTVLGTFSDSSALPFGGAGTLETSLAGAAHAALSAGAGALPQAVTKKVGPPAVFQAFGPQRLVDTRNPTAGQYGGPAFAANDTRTINVAPYALDDPSIPSADLGDQPPTSNLPANVTAVSVILFIVGAPAAEYFTAYATGTSPAPTGTATVFADRVGQIIAASAIVPVSASGNIDVYSSSGGNLIIDVTGYFLDALDGTDNLPISGNVPGGAGNSGVLVGTNASTTASANGVTGIIATTESGVDAAGVRGINNGTGPFGFGFGVYGSHASTGVGVFGSAAGAGVGGFFTAGVGGFGVRGVVSGASTGGLFSAGAGGIGVSGGASGANSIGGAFNANTAVSGTSSSTTSFATAIVGTISSTSPGGFSAGVRGINNGTGGNGIGVYGSQAGTGWGVYGTTAGAGIGVRGEASGAGSYGVFAAGNLGASGTKAFVDPSPSDPSKQIAYVALEGNEVGTYFGGTGHFVNGVATIDVPQSFRDVTEASGLRVQVTPEGSTITGVSVKSFDLNHVVVMGSQDVDFFYTVNGIRKGYAGYDPVQPNRIYVPHSATDTLPTWLTDTQRQTLIANGTYNADGTVNLTTAHALGWDLLWASDGTSTGSAASGTAAAK